jgi:molecular chaperone DnaK
LRITAPNKLDAAEVERMRKQAEEFAEQDKKHKEDIETVNQADALVYTSEKQLKEFEGKISEKEVEKIKEKIAELKKMLEEKKPAAEIKKKLDETQKAFHKAAEELYKKAAPKTQPGQDDVVDAEKA